MPKWTVMINLRGKDYVGTTWEFFREEADADACVQNHRMMGNGAVKVPFEPRHAGARAPVAALAQREGQEGDCESHGEEVRLAVCHDAAE